MRTNDSNSRIWEAPPQTLHLDADEVHVWRVFLNTSPPSDLDRLWTTLSPDEIERARNYIQPRDRDRFVCTRVILRLLLSRYTDCGPHEIVFTYNPHDKPSIDDSVCQPAPSFNLSHAYDLALVAVTSRRNVGIDVEFIRNDVDHLSVAKSFFSQNEYEMLQTVASQQKTTAFYNAWTRKEAYTKARGEGLALLKTVEVTLMPGEPADIVATSDDPLQANLWSLLDLDPASDYVGALAVEGHDWRLSCYQW